MNEMPKASQGLPVRNRPTNGWRGRKIGEALTLALIFSRAGGNLGNMLTHFQQPVQRLNLLSQAHFCPPPMPFLLLTESQFRIALGVGGQVCLFHRHNASLGHAA